MKRMSSAIVAIAVCTMFVEAYQLPWEWGSRVWIGPSAPTLKTMVEANAPGIATDAGSHVIVGYSTEVSETQWEINCIERRGPWETHHGTRGRYPCFLLTSQSD
jgi:hypothetical protein